MLLLLLAACSPASTLTHSLAAASTPTHTASSTPTASPGATGPAVPADFPVMPGSDAAAPLPHGPSLVARWTTAADGAQVYGFFVSALPAAGFEIEQLAPGGDAATIIFRSPGAPELELSLTADGDGTRIDLRLPETAD
ncbi:MAG: hypothetical protein ABJC24_07735 [Chloroflexota bacterium]